MTHAGLHARIRKTRSRAAVLKWEARQAALAHGVWYRLRRLLAYSCEIWAVDDAIMDELIAGGFTVSPVGEQIEPPKRILVLPLTDCRQLCGARRLPLGLGPELFAERNLVLVPWDDDLAPFPPRPVIR
jgi:hypothetical protein